MPLQSSKIKTKLKSTLNDLGIIMRDKKFVSSMCDSLEGDEIQYLESTVVCLHKYFQSFKKRSKP